MTTRRKASKFDARGWDRELLTEVQRRAVAMREEGLGHQEIARLTGRSAGSVKAALARAKRVQEGWR